MPFLIMSRRLASLKGDGDRASLLVLVHGSHQSIQKAIAVLENHLSWASRVAKIAHPGQESRGETGRKEPGW